MIVVLQVIIALLMIFVVYIAVSILMNRNVISTKPNRVNKSDTSIIKGYGSLSQFNDLRFSTQIPHAPHYVRLSNSINRYGGTQYTYSFWMNISTNANLTNKIILLRGDPSRYDMLISGDNGSETTYNGRLINSPCIRFGSKMNELVVEYNTMQFPLNSYTISDNKSIRRNLLSLAQNRWAMFTFVFQDNVNVSDFSDGIKIQLYINGDLYDTHTSVGKTLLNTVNDLWISPGTVDQTGCSSTMIGDITYHNHAMQYNDIRKLYNIGRPEKASDKVNNGSHRSLHLSEFNKLDIYNV